MKSINLPAIKFFAILVGSIFLSADLEAGENDYIYPNQEPSFSNYGTLGLFSSPSARFLDEGSLGFAWNHMQPYLRGSLIAYPFNWLEASFQYTDINNQLYSEFATFSGNQTFKDKSFDIKLKILNERDFAPALALGFRDFAGTGIFSSEYIVASKKVNNFDITFGLGWGMLSGNDIANPFVKISDDFKVRKTVEGTKGGEFTVDSYFSGEMGSFGGIEWFLPHLNGARLKIEYDGIDYSKEGFPPIKQASKFNAGIVYPVSKGLHLKLGIIRGNTLNFGFTFSANFSKKNSFIPKLDPHKPVENADTIKMINTDNDEFLFKSSLKFLADNSLHVQAASVDHDAGELEIAFSQNKHASYVRSIGRVARVLDDISPYNIKSFKIKNLNADQGMYEVEIDRSKLQRYDSKVIPGIHLGPSNVSPASYAFENYQFQPTTKLPRHFYKIAPMVRSQIGGPDGFYFGNFRMAFKSETLITKNFTLDADFSYGVADNMGELKLASDSILPRVRTEIVQYLKQGRGFTVDSFQANYFSSPGKNIYTKISAGYFEQMFGGVGGEVLYRPFYKPWSVGAELWRVKQRDYDGSFNFLDYQTTTGFINFFYEHPGSQILFKLKGGKFLAKDSGVNLDLSRRFKSGLNMGVYFSLTDISRDEFGEGSFDKGFYFFIPIETFFSNYSSGHTGFGFRPVQRDGAAVLFHSYDLLGITDQASYDHLLRDWDDLYD